METTLSETTRRCESSTPTILYIDDDLDILCAIELRFQSFDVNLVRASDGMEGFAEAIERKPDVIVMDLDMPYGDGMTMLKCIRHDPATKDIPVIILTGMRDPTLKKTLSDMGANGFLQKPISFDDLMRELSRYITFYNRFRELTPSA